MSIYKNDPYYNILYFPTPFLSSYGHATWSLITTPIAVRSRYSCSSQRRILRKTSLGGHRIVRASSGRQRHSEVVVRGGSTFLRWSARFSREAPGLWGSLVRLFQCLADRKVSVRSKETYVNTQKSYHRYVPKSSYSKAERRQQTIQKAA